MSSIKAKVIISVLLAAVIAGLGGVISWQYQRNETLLQAKTEQTQLAAQRLLSIRRLEDATAQQSAALQALAKEQRAINTQFTQREQLVRSLQRENEMYAKWATGPLPDAVKRLRTRPAVTGSGEYRQWLSDTNALLSASGATPTEQ